MRFELKVAIRYFRSGGLQSVLTVLGVAVGVAVFVFIASLIGGLQESLIQKVIGSISHVTLEAKERDPRTYDQMQGSPKQGELNLTRVEKYGQREAKIAEWKPLVNLLDREPGLAAVSPLTAGSAFATRGNQIKPVTLRGVEPDRANRIVNLRKNMVQGRFEVGGDSCVIGVELAKDLGVGLKDKIRTRSSKNRERTFTVEGIFDVGILELNQRSFYISLSNAQRMLDLVGYITSIEMQVSNVFQANDIADRIAAKTGLETKSWMRQNKEFLGALQAQTGSSTLIKVFVMVSVAFGIASVLVVSVVQKAKEIGILKSMGARTRSIMLIFLMQGLFVGAFGSLVGSGVSALMIWGLLQVPGTNPAQTGTLFPVHLQPIYLIQAGAASMIIGTLAGMAPARRAAKLDPIEVIRYG